MSKNQMIAKVEKWVRKIEKDFEEKALYRFEDYPRSDGSVGFLFYFDGLLYEVLNGYRNDGDFNSYGESYAALCSGTGWFQDCESYSVDVFVPDC